MLWRSLLIQAAWNYRGMQHLGLLFAQLPALPAEPGARRAAMGRAFGFYNAHPYLCGYLLGAAARLEPLGQGEDLARLKKAAIPPLGAAGDRLFWAGLKPLCGTVGVLALTLLAAGETAQEGKLARAVVAAALATLGYNLVHVHWRRRALRDGHRLGLGVAASIRALATHPGLARAGQALSLLAGLALPLAAGRAMAAEGGGAAAPLLFLAAGVASWQLPARAVALPLLLAALAALWML